MKKGIQMGLIVASLALVTQVVFADYATMPVFTNMTKTSTTVSFTIGNDEFAAAVKNRQPIKLKYGKTGETKMIEIPLEYNIETNLPSPIQLTGLKANQSYTVLLGQRAVRTCMTEELCAAIYTKYGTQGFSFKTKGDAVKTPLITQKLSLGDKSDEVILLKKYLVRKGYMKPSTTNVFDIPTLVGVIKFQLARNGNGEADGVIGASGRAVINQELTAQANAGINL